MSYLCKKILIKYYTMKLGRKLLFMAMLLVTFDAVAESVWIDDVCYDLIPENSTAKVSTGLLASGEIVIPSVVTHEGVDYVVVSIEDNAFMGRDITSIVLPESVKRIGSYAFSQCRSLGSVVLPKGGVDIRSYAFANCSSLNSIIFPEGEVTVGERAFVYCSGLTSVTISENVNLLAGGNVFYGCDNLERVKIYCEHVDDWFRSNETIKEVVLGEQVVTIGEYAFYECTGLSTVVIPEDARLTTIGKGAFEYCQSLPSIYIPRRVTDIGWFAFDGCSNLERVTMNCTVVGSWFDGSETIKEFILGDDVEVIGSSAFYDCAGLTSIVIPRGVKSIGGSAFSECENLRSMVVAEGNKVYDSRGGCNAIIETATNTLLAGCAATVVPDDIASLASSAFGGCVNLRSIALPEGVTSMGNSVFYDCTNLVSVVLPSTLTSIGGSAFSGCESLASVTIPEGVDTIRMWTFADCRSLTTITIPWTVREIGYEAFANCSGLTSITCHAATPPSCIRNAFSGVDTSIPVYVPTAAVADYQSASEWCLFTNIVGVNTGIVNHTIGIQGHKPQYDLQGRLIAEPDRIKGISIVSGKKVMRRF